MIQSQSLPIAADIAKRASNNDLDGAPFVCFRLRDHQAT